MKARLSMAITIAMASQIVASQVLAQENGVSEADQLQISVQKICPVSGNDLGSMGAPVKIRAGEQIAFLCCQGCLSKEITVEHWSTIQERIAKAQGNCPIMDKAVDSSMESTVVNGQQVFVCCPPCIPKIQEDAKSTLAKVNAAYAEFVATERRAESDHLHATAQGICPVSGSELGSKGEPIKVKVGNEEHAFLCCQDCVGKEIQADHWKTIQNNLAKAQGICPVMGSPVDASKESTVVNGRRIFVCCPPCIKQIQEKPNEFVAKLNFQITENVDTKKR